MGAISRKIANLCLNKAAISALTVAPGAEQRTTLAQVRDTSAVTPKEESQFRTEGALHGIAYEPNSVCGWLQKGVYGQQQEVERQQ